MTVKIFLTDEHLTELGRLASAQLTTAAQAWGLGMTCLRIDSKEYRALCSAGKAAQRSYHRLRSLAEECGWTSEQTDAVFTVHDWWAWG